MNQIELVNLGLAFDLKGNQVGHEYFKGSRFSHDVEFDGATRFGRNITIGAARINSGAYGYINDHTSIEQKAVLEQDARLDSHVYLEAGVHIFPDSWLERDVRVGEHSIIGSKVRIPAEAQLGDHSVVPNSRTIVTLGRFGTRERTVTIHGSDEGPRYSIGCQNSVDWQTIKDRILNHTDTSLDSAQHYAHYLDAYNAIGRVVQLEYDRLGSVVNDLRSIAFADFDQQTD